jgi:RNA polymerase sigma factor (sigma-70 family)
MSTRSVHLLSDADLVAACREGQEAAWRELVERFSRYVYAIARQAYGLSERDSEEVFQETFVRVYEHLDRLRDEAALRPWIAQLARRLCVDRFRGSSREVPVEQLPEEPESDRTLARLDEALAVRAGLACLSEACQEILDRFFARDQSYHTISAELDLPSGTIASRISRCLGSLRKVLRQENTDQARLVD